MVQQTLDYHFYSPLSNSSAGCCLEQHLYFFLRARSGVDPPDPIPNSEVKHASADDTWGAAPWESRSVRGFILKKVSSEVFG